MPARTPLPPPGDATPELAQLISFDIFCWTFLIGHFMRNYLVLVVVAMALCTNVACKKSSNTNSSPSANANSSPLPPGISTSPIPPGGTPTPGIPDVNAPKNNNQPSGTPTPGIPDLKSQKNSKTPPLNESTTPSKGPVAAAQASKKRP